MKAIAAVLLLTGIAAADPLATTDLVADPGCTGTCTTVHTAAAGKLRVEVRERVDKLTGAHFLAAFSDAYNTWVTDELDSPGEQCGTGKCWSREITGTAIVVARDVAWISFDIESDAGSIDPHNPHPWQESAKRTIVIGCTLTGAVPSCATARPSKGGSSHATIDKHSVTFEYDDRSRETVAFGF